MAGLLGWKGVLGVLGAGGLIAWLTIKPTPPLKVEVAQVSLGVVRELVPASSTGRVVPKRRVVLRAELAATVRQVGFRAGERVEAEAVLVRFDSDELSARIRQAKANLDAAGVAVRSAQTRAAAAGRALDRATKLKERQAISEVELERATTEKEAAELGVEQARAAEAQAKAALELAQVAQGRAVVRAPFAGVLQDVSAEVGVQVTPGAPLVDLIDDSIIEVEVPVDEADVARLRPDMVVHLRAGRSDQTLSGRVRFIPPAVGRGEGERSLEAAALKEKDRAFMVRVALDQAHNLRVGASVSAEFLVSATENVMWVPTQAVMGRGRQRSVYVLDKGRLQKVQFEPGLTSWERTEVKAGLAENDQVVVNLATRGLEEGVKVVAEPPRD